MHRAPVPRTRTAILAAAVLTFGGLTAIAPAGAEQTDVPTASVPESTSGSYIVVMEADPLVADFETTELGTPSAEAAAAEIVESHEAVLEEVGAEADDRVQSYTNALNGFSAVLTHAEAEALAAQKVVKLVEPDELRQLQTDASPAFLGLTGRGGAWASGVTGEGVVVGVIDSGIWPEHPSFADDGSYAAPSIPPLATTIPDGTPTGTPSDPCDFGNSTHNPNDADFTCNNKLVGARQMMFTYRALVGADPDEFDSARDDDGHGTHTASTAAGNRGVRAEIFDESLGRISGVAPRAHIIAYKGLGNLGGFGSDLAAAIDQAVADGVDVINYSVGGGPTLTGAEDIAYLFAADAGVFVATSAGNSGSAASTIGGPASVPWLTTVGASTQSRFFTGEVTLSNARKGSKGKSSKGRGNREITGASVTQGTGRALRLVDAANAGNELCVPGDFTGDVSGAIVLCLRGGVGRAEKSKAVADAGGKGMILYNTTNIDDLFTDNHAVPSVHVDLDEGLAVKAYIAANARPRAEISTGWTTRWKSAPSMTLFSSRGPDPVAEDIIKPDVTAPGQQILAGNSPFPDPDAVQGELFQSIGGTSMSSPHVAGLFALLKQVHPDWTPAMAKSALMTTASQDVRDNDRVSQADPFDMGAGHVDPGKVAREGSMFNPGLVYDAGINEYFGFLCEAAPEVFRDAAASCAYLESLGVPTTARNLNLPSIGIASVPGARTITRTVTSVADRTVHWKVKVDAPEGYDVTVTPRRLTLEPGASASYTVTFTNNGGGPVGEWRFGSLEWRGGNFEAYSPIAIKGTLLDAPAAVSGTGLTGSGSFDVSFGYTGPYSAKPHGLVLNAPVSGDISQDPDQTFPSADDGVGVDKIPFTVTGSAFARWSVVIDGDADIDLYLLKGETLVASSTNGGTDELIELTQPEDGQYTLVVHGWSVPVAQDPLAYTVDHWSVPLATGGTLAVNSAPTSAVLGTSGTVSYSWNVPAAGEYLGAVSHNDGTGIIGLTLVEVSAPAP